MVMKRMIYILLAIVMMACSSKKTTEENNTASAADVIVLTEQQVKNAGIATGSMTKQPLSATLRLTGTIEAPPQNLFSINAAVDGFVRKTNLVPGMHVNKGDVLAVIESQAFVQLQQDYLTAKARLQLFKSEYERQKDLNASKASSDKVLEQAEADYRTQVVLLRSLGEKISITGMNPNQLNENNISRYLSVRCPVNGFVANISTNIGKYVASNEELFRIIDPSDIHLLLKVFEKDLNLLQVGQPVIAYTNGAPEKKYPADIQIISKNINDDRSAEVHCHFDRYDHLLLPGTYMNAEVIIKSKELWTVPEDAVVRAEGKEFIFIETQKGTYKMTAVQTGVKENGFIEIKTGDTMVASAVVLKGAYSLLMAARNKSDE